MKIFTISRKRRSYLGEDWIPFYFYVIFKHFQFFGPLAMLVLPILIPINLVRGLGRKGGVNGLDTLSWSNISPKHTARYWAHLYMALVVIVWVCHVVDYEICSYTKVRHRRLRSVDRFKNACGTTVLVTDIPSSFLKENHLRTLYNVFPGGTNISTSPVTVDVSRK